MVLSLETKRPEVSNLVFMLVIIGSAIQNEHQRMIVTEKIRSQD